MTAALKPARSIKRARAKKQCDVLAPATRKRESRKTELRQRFRTATDLPDVLPVTSREIDILFWHARDLIELLLRR